MASSDELDQARGCGEKIDTLFSPACFVRHGAGGVPPTARGTPPGEVGGSPAVRKAFGSRCRFRRKEDPASRQSHPGELDPEPSLNQGVVKNEGCRWQGA